MKTEAQLKRVLVNELKRLAPGAVIFRHEDRFVGGIPDISVTLNRRTVWVEAKRDKTPSNGLQDLIVSRLATVGLCWYVIYRTDFIEIMDPVTRNITALVNTNVDVAKFILERCNT